MPLLPLAAILAVAVQQADVIRRRVVGEDGKAIENAFELKRLAGEAVLVGDAKLAAVAAVLDAVPLLRGDFERRAADTLAWIRIPKRGRTVTPLPNGGVVLSATVNPMSVIDDWAVLPDGGVAILRGQDYHMDWIGADGRRWSSPKLPFDWRRLTDDDKRAIVDSTRRAIETMAATMSTSGAAAGLTAAAGGMTSHSMTIMPVGAADAPAPRAPTPSAPSVPEVVPPSELPDYVPPVLRAGTMRADRAGNVWILPTTSAQAGEGLLHDVVSGRGELVRRVRLPAGRALEGFGADGAVYRRAFPATASLSEAEAARYSPLRLVSSAAAPALIVHGDADTVVPMVEGETMHGALTSAGVTASFLRVAGAGHGFGGADLERVNAAMVQWFQQHLRAAAR